ncbi:hypothetical protein QEH59_10850 [Coraliomargarita sp. SDUM461004]|uniref:Type II secretion system protein GspE N-terminal domain-containing protein n=1 Tax=Thalassobacterium sedimentorum TaxID=3041258 RepID=A0ABU1AJD5_9BACT|nr:hypothetical protein [Coraliomargarita sp. SDUM461004]MDQ8194927.1 hypothetical protein [Coraliomargarita sp. SDUM461004]
MQQHRALILRSNRFLGSALVDKGLVSSSDLEEANGKFMEAIQSADLKRASILSTLLFELKKLEEAKLLEYLVEEEKLGLIDLAYVELQSLRPMNVDLSLCWASSTVPFDYVEGTYMVATCYYMSAPVVKHWESVLDGRVIWYGTSTSSFSRALERIEEIHEAEDTAKDEL